jgi:hypothetical protein
MQVSFGSYADDCIATILLCPAVVLYGTVRYRRDGRYLLAQQASTLPLPAETVDADHGMLANPPKRLSSAR